MTLSHASLAFVVEFIAACRTVSDDAGLASLLDRLRGQVGAARAWTQHCGSGGAPRSDESDCRPARTAIPETTDYGLRSCQHDAAGASVCLMVETPAGSVAGELLAHVGPHLLDAVSRLAARSPRIARPRLTSREEEVLRWVIEGKSNWEIGRILAMSERTVKYHLTNLFAKFGVTTRAQVAALAVALRVLPNPSEPAN